MGHSKPYWRVIRARHGMAPDETFVMEKANAVHLVLIAEFTKRYLQWLCTIHISLLFLWNLVVFQSSSLKNKWQSYPDSNQDYGIKNPRGLPISQ